MGKRWTNPLLSVLLVAGMVGLLARAADGTRDYQRIRLVSLETLLSTKQAVLKDKWADLARLDSRIKDSISADEDVIGDSATRTQDQARELLANADVRKEMEDERARLVKSINDLYAEEKALKSELSKVRAEMQETQQVLDGHWSITLMPAGTKGDVYLSQNGTLVTGDYRLDNGQTGSLQGTFVNNVLVIERIDQRYGKMGRFEGSLTKGGQSVKGSWYSYDFASGQPLTGPFSLDRTPEGSSNP